MELSRKINSKNIMEECNFYDVEKNVSCYKKGKKRANADSRILCNEHYHKYLQILETRDTDQAIQ